MPSVADETGKAQKNGAPFVGTVVHENPARKEYEETIEEWVAGRASYEDVIARDPYRHNRSLFGFLLCLLSGQTRSKRK